MCGDISTSHNTRKRQFFPMRPSLHLQIEMHKHFWHIYKTTTGCMGLEMEDQGKWRQVIPHQFWPLGDLSPLYRYLSDTWDTDTWEDNVKYFIGDTPRHKTYKPKASTTPCEKKVRLADWLQVKVERKLLFYKTVIGHMWAYRISDLGISAETDPNLIDKLRVEDAEIRGGHDMS